ncbi:MAG: T9SS type A sorting domain-containing protein [Crocinitomicaceae bacterium]|nr:T9SS type A sorting domain-containing protein [Crocinitomicaceae bacterium]
MRITFLSVLLIALSNISFGQFQFDFNQDLPVKIGADTLNNSWAGGLNYAQLSDFDFDFDGDLDLFVFDRSSNNIRVYTQEGEGANKHYELSYNAKNRFPSDLRYRCALVDYDNDGRKDLFTYGIGGIKVYRNIGDVVSGLQWELASDLIYTTVPNGYQNLYVSSSDIPAIVDVDFDGDIDVLTFHIGGQHLEYHQNQSMELYGIPDSLIFIQKNECWGKFREDFSTNLVVLNDPNSPCVGGGISNPESGSRSGAHSGSTVLALDIDNSGVMDLVLGDVAFPNLTLLINGGTAPNTDSPMISADNAFPSNTTPANMNLFPASFFLDVDFDGVKDLIVAANAKVISENERSIVFYKNYGSNALPNFVYTQNDFLQDEMIDHGNGSIPVFTDINEDGLEDMIVSNFFRYKPVLDKEASIAYYQNTGTSTDPVFTFVDDNFFNLPSLGLGLRSVPTFGDLDNDGDKDMILGLENGTLAYVENQSTGSGSVFSSVLQNYSDNNGTIITADAFCYPQLFDLDDDGLLDLILGRKDGTMMYYQNTGTANTPEFTLYNSFLGNLNVSSNSPDGYATPHFFRYDDTTRLFVGDLSGRMHFISDIDGNLDPGQPFVKESNNYLGINTEAYSSFWVSDMDTDGNLELYAGQDLGGIYRYEHDANSNVSINEIEQSKLNVYPNPTNNLITLSSNDVQIERIQLINLQSQLVFSEETSSKKVEINLEDYPSGIYFVSAELSNGQTVTKKVIKQ